MKTAYGSLVLGFLSIIIFVFIIFVPKASAEDFYFFRVESEIDVLIAKTGGATVKWVCDGTGEGIVTDNTASESTNALDGIIKVASTSVENNSTHAGCNAGEAITATASFGGWVTRRWTGTVSSAGSNVTFTTGASLDYTILVNGVDDELGTAITLNGTAASATYSGTVASESYSAGKKYIAGSTSGGTVKGGADGYVNRTSSALTVSATASQSVDFGVETNSSLNESGLSFAVKATLNGTNRHGTAINNITGATVKAGNNAGTSCTDNSDGKYYCAIPLSHTGVTAKATAIPQGFSDAECTYTDRTAGGDVQSTCTIAATEPNAGGSVVSTPTPTPTPSPTPTPAPSPTLTVTAIPTPTPSVVSSPTPVPVVLFRKARDPKVYTQGADGTLRWIKTAAEFIAAGYNWADVKAISGSEFAKMRIGGQLRVVRGIGYLRVRQDASTKSKILGQVLPGQQYEFFELKNGWYKINLGWVFGGYANEI